MDQGTFPTGTRTKGITRRPAGRSTRSAPLPKDEPFFRAAGFFLLAYSSPATPRRSGFRPPIRTTTPVLPPIKENDRDDTPVLLVPPLEPRAAAEVGPGERPVEELSARSWPASTSFVDAQVGRLMAALDEAGLAENIDRRPVGGLRPASRGETDRQARTRFGTGWPAASPRSSPARESRPEDAAHAPPSSRHLPHADRPVRAPGRDDLEGDQLCFRNSGIRPHHVIVPRLRRTTRGTTDLAANAADTFGMPMEAKSSTTSRPTPHEWENVISQHRCRNCSGASPVDPEHRRPASPRSAQRS